MSGERSGSPIHTNESSLRRPGGSSGINATTGEPLSPEETQQYVNRNYEQQPIPENVGPEWPQNNYSPIGLLGKNTRGFLQPELIPITDDGEITTSFKLGAVEITDWRGVKLDINGRTDLSTKDRFDEGRLIPKTASDKKPYSTRDHYLIFGDQSTDYFRHGLHVIENLTPLDNGPNGDIRLKDFKSTTFEHNDPVMFGFDIIFNDITSPLLNGSIDVFLDNYSMVDEIAARRPVYEDFKNQFVKFFKTKATVRINEELLQVTRMRDKGTYVEGRSGKDSIPYYATEGKHDLDGDGRNRKAYLNYYLKKIDGLDKLIERNTPDAKKYLQEYNKDIITLTFDEDLTLSFGALARLYKLLYWSKPGGKAMIPDNLLRFNCSIYISEVRNYNRVRKAISGNKQSLADLEVIKDNVSRYRYDLSECQFYFDTVPHDTSVDMGSIKTWASSAQVKFDYKFSTTKFERWVPYPRSGDTEGLYVGYNDGAIWKIGNPRNSDGSSATPEFLTYGDDKTQSIKFPADGNAGFVLSKTSNTKYKGKYVEVEQPVDDPVGESPEQQTEKAEEESNKEEQRVGSGQDLENFASSTAEKAKAEADRIKGLAFGKFNAAKQGAINVREMLLSNTLNKIANAGVSLFAKNITGKLENMGVSTKPFGFDIGELVQSAGSNIFGTENGIKAPRNIYQQPYFYKDPNSGQTFYNDRNFSADAVPPGPISLPYSIRFYDVRAQLLNFVGDSLGDRFYTYNIPSNPL